jgi:hypothetical protein
MTGANGGADLGARPGWRWDVALSFAGAQRDYVEQVATALQARGVRCFYDADEQIDLWGKYLAEELPAIYGEQAAAVVVFVSAEYAARDWTRHERRAALNRAVHERREYVLPARFDDTPLPGLLSDMVTVDLRTRSPQQFAAMIADKLARLAIAAADDARGPAQAVEAARPAVEAELARRVGTARESESGPVRATASHFARLSYDWGSGMPVNEDGYLHGSVAISCADIGPTSSYGRVFDSDFQRSLAQLQEGGILRRGGHRFDTHHDWTRSSYLVYGNITSGSSVPSFIGVEVHTYGAVSVYFREYTKAATIDELVGWWIYGAWWMALEVQALLGTSGPAHAAILVDLAGVSDLPVRQRPWLVTSLYGPFPLWSAKSDDELDPMRALAGGDEEKRYYERYHWPMDAAETQIAFVRADLLRKSAGTDRLGEVDEERDWTPWDVRSRLGHGRQTDPPRAGRPGRRTGRRG